MWINGEETGDYQRACAPRFEAIKNYLELHYQRRLSCFDLGCNYGYFGNRLTSELDCVSVLVDTKPLHGILQRLTAGPRIWLNRRLDNHDLWRIAESESFDVVLALNVVHHFKDWRGAVDALLKLGETVIFELPGHGDVGTANYAICDDLRNYVLSMPHEQIFEMESHVSGVMRPMVVLEGENSITKQAIDAELRNCHPVKVNVRSLPETKSIVIQHKRTLETREFIHGMNLWNFYLLNGVWPKDIKQMVEDAVQKMERFHDDLRPWNFILDGEKVYPIDFRDKTWRDRPEENGLETCLELLSRAPYTGRDYNALLRTA